MMISIALTGGSPGSSPKTKTRTSVPTPPQRPRPMPPERTPSAMNPMTTRPSIATRSQSHRAHVELCSSFSCWQVLDSRTAAASSGSRRATSAIVSTPPASTSRIALAAPVSWPTASSSVSASSSSESWACSKLATGRRPSRTPAPRRPRPERCRGRRRCRYPRRASSSRGRCCSSPVRTEPPSSLRGLRLRLLDAGRARATAPGGSSSMIASISPRQSRRRRRRSAPIRPPGPSRRSCRGFRSRRSRSRTLTTPGGDREDPAQARPRITSARRLSKARRRRRRAASRSAGRWGC